MQFHRSSEDTRLVSAQFDTVPTHYLEVLANIPCCVLTLHEGTVARFAPQYVSSDYKVELLAEYQTNRQT